MELTEKKAIQLCKEMWEQVELSGMGQDDWLKLHPELEYGQYGCPLCQWVQLGEEGWNIGQKVDNSLWCRDSQRVCPLIRQFGKSCVQLGYKERLFDAALPTAGFYKAIKELK